MLAKDYLFWTYFTAILWKPGAGVKPPPLDCALSLLLHSGLYTNNFCALCTRFCAISICTICSFFYFFFANTSFFIIKNCMNILDFRNNVKLERNKQENTYKIIWKRWWLMLLIFTNDFWIMRWSWVNPHNCYVLNSYICLGWAAFTLYI